MKPPFIPPATREKLLNPAQKGGRHKQMIAIALSLLGNGLYPEAVFAQLRQMFPDTGADTLSDDEIHGVVDGAVDYDLQPSTPGYRRSERAVVEKSAPCPPAASAMEEIEKFLDGFRCDEATLKGRSPIPILSHGYPSACWFLKGLFQRDEFINLVWNFAANGEGKLVPSGFGETHLLSEWTASILKTGAVPQDRAGCWIRLNPTDGNGIADRNVKGFRYTLVEFDEVPVALQLAFFAKVRLPIAALVKSGGKSVHAWVKLDAPDAATYKTRVTQIHEALRRFGIDPANKNPSRLARMPGARRADGGASGDGEQRLLYLNPKPTSKAIVEATSSKPRTSEPARAEVADE